jgi:hypothetical protein
MDHWGRGGRRKHVVFLEQPSKSDRQEALWDIVEMPEDVEPHPIVIGACYRGAGGDE